MSSVIDELVMCGKAWNEGALHERGYHFNDCWRRFANANRNYVLTITKNRIEGPADANKDPRDELQRSAQTAGQFCKPILTASQWKIGDQTLGVLTRIGSSSPRRALFLTASSYEEPNAKTVPPSSDKANQRSRGACFRACKRRLVCAVIITSSI
jgi:hypothetical protein